MERFVSFGTMAAVMLFVALAVVQLGAYVRLSDAGLGCPDWPGCYGKAVVPERSDLFSERPLEHGKAWKEMIHRYAAGGLGILVLIAFVMSYAASSAAWARPWTAALMLITLFQAVLGMWTVTWRLQPIVVTAHLLGGFAVAALLLRLTLGPKIGAVRLPAAIARSCRISLAVVALQVMLGGWTSANYAAPVCADFPQCQGEWWPPMDFAGAFQPAPLPESGDYEGGALDGRARTAIHVTHRIGALLTLVVVGGTAWRLLNTAAGASAAVMGAVLLLQFGLGLANVWLQFPLALAVAHNSGGALLFLAVFAVNLRVRAIRSLPAREPTVGSVNSRPMFERSHDS